MDISIKQQAEGEKHAGYWTFSVDGQPSLWYSSNEAGVQRKMQRLMKASSGTVILEPLIANAAAMSDEQIAAAKERRRSESTIGGFMKRGKLSA